MALERGSRVTGNHADFGDLDSGGGIYKAGTVTVSHNRNVIANEPDNCVGDPVPFCVG